MGVCADETRLAFSKTELSSIDLNTREIGHRAGLLLMEIIHGRLRWPEEMLLSPMRIGTRHSTDRLAVADRLVVQALDFIRGHESERISVPDGRRAVAGSRRRLPSDRDRTARVRISPPAATAAPLSP